MLSVVFLPLVWHAIIARLNLSRIVLRHTVCFLSAYEHKTFDSELQTMMFMCNLFCKKQWLFPGEWSTSRLWDQFAY